MDNDRKFRGKHSWYFLLGKIQGALGLGAGRGGGGVTDYNEKDHVIIVKSIYILKLLLICILFI